MVSKAGRYKRFSRKTSTPRGYYQHWKCEHCGKVPRTLYSYVYWNGRDLEPRMDSGLWFCNSRCFAACEKEIKESSCTL